MSLEIEDGRNRRTVNSPSVPSSSQIFFIIFLVFIKNFHYFSISIIGHGWNQVLLGRPWLFTAVCEINSLTVEISTVVTTTDQSSTTVTVPITVSLSQGAGSSTECPVIMSTISPFLPWLQTEPWYVCCTAGLPRVTLGNSPEDLSLHVVDTVPVITGDPGQARLPQLCQLVLSEFCWIGRGVVEEPVRLLESLELVPKDTLEGGTDDASCNCSLADSTHEQIYIVNMFVDLLEEIHNISWNETNQGIKILCSSLIAEFSEPCVSWQTVIPTPLQVQSCQIQSEGSISSEEKVGQLFREESIECLPWLSGQTNQQFVQIIFDQ